MIFLYNFFIRSYIFLIRIASFFNKKAELWINGRKNILQNIENQLKSPEKRIWIHCASLGEFEQGRPIIETLKRNFPQYKIFLTFFSPSGFEVRKNYSLADYIFYLPADTPKNAKRFIDLIAPKMAFFVKYEFWYNYLNYLKIKEIQTYLISGIFRENQIFFRFYGKWYRKLLTMFSHLFVQNEVSKRLLASISVENVTISGDTRFDRVLEVAKQSKELTVLNNFKNNSFVFIAGSTWKPDESLIIRYINETLLPIKFIIAPHEIHESHIENLISQIQKKTLRYSQASNLSEAEVVDNQVLIIDNVGMLSSAYSYGNVAYVGGGFGVGIHNVLEPAVWKIPVIFGKKYQKFNEAVELIKRAAAFSILNYEMLRNLIDKFFENQHFCVETGEKAFLYIVENQGATGKIFSQVNF